MALITLDFYSRELKMSTLVTVLAPDSTGIGQIPLSQRKVLYLLHGLSDDSTSIMRFTRAELFAREAGIVVVMPSVCRSMYCDDVLGQNYFSHVTEELPEYLELVMGLSRRREDNYIAGISMGGMGAARVALTYPERYIAVGLFSGALDLKMLIPFITEEQQSEFPFLMPGVVDIDNTPLSPINLLDAEKHKDLVIIVRCGREDDLLPMSQSFYEKAKGLGLNATFTIGEGGHVWRIWDSYVDDFITLMKDSTDIS